MSDRPLQNSAEGQGAMSVHDRPKTPIHTLPPDIQDLIRRLRKQAQDYRRKYQELKRQQAAQQ